MIQILMYVMFIVIGALLGCYFTLKWCERELDKELIDEWNKFTSSTREQHETKPEPKQKTYTADKCSFPDGVDVRPDGMHKLDPCIYTRRETHKNVTVNIDQCLRCGHIQLSWDAQANSEHEIHSKLAMPDEDSLTIKRYLKRDEENDGEQPEFEEDEETWND